MTELPYILIPLLLILDTLTVLMRVGLLNASLPRLLAQREHSPARVDRAIRLVQALPKVQASLNLARLIWRYLIAGTVAWLWLSRPDSTGWLSLLGVMAALAFLVFWLDWSLSMLVMRAPEAWAVRLGWAALILTWTLSPLTFLAMLFTGDAPHSQEFSGQLHVTQDDLKTMVDAGQQEGLLEQGEQRMIHGIFDLGDTLAREIMVPRIDVIALDVLTPVNDALDALLSSGYSRVPVFEETVDNIHGLLYAKDLLRVWREGDHLGNLRSLLRPAYFIPEAKKVDELLAEMQSQRIHMAIVVDEYGGVAGLVTLEDIVEEILGEIQDEFDSAEESPYESLSDNEFLFLGRIDLDDFNEIVAGKLPKEEADTLGGFMYSQLGHVPAPGEVVEVNNLKLTVEQVIGRRIRKVRVRWLSAPAESQEKVDHADE